MHIKTTHRLLLHTVRLTKPIGPLTQVYLITNVLTGTVLFLPKIHKLFIDIYEKGNTKVGERLVQVILDITYEQDTRLPSDKQLEYSCMKIKHCILPALKSYDLFRNQSLWNAKKLFLYHQRAD